MTATLQAAVERISISSETVREAQETTETVRRGTQRNSVRGASLVLRTADGLDVELPNGIQDTLLSALASIASTGSVSIGQVPDELTSTVAADMLGVSRPTLLKWARQGVIESFTVGTHTRFHRDDVVALRAKRAAERRQALDELMAFDLEHEELLDD